MISENEMQWKLLNVIPFSNPIRQDLLSLPKSDYISRQIPWTLITLRGVNCI